jgi:hypothetical protein
MKYELQYTLLIIGGIFFATMILVCCKVCCQATCGKEDEDEDGNVISSRRADPETPIARNNPSTVVNTKIMYCVANGDDGKQQEKVFAMQQTTQVFEAVAEKKSARGMSYQRQ